MTVSCRSFSESIAEKPSSLDVVHQRRKILPSKDLLRDCETDEALFRSCDSDQWIESLVGDSSERTPDSLATSDYLNNSVFDGELDWNGVCRVG